MVKKILYSILLGLIGLIVSTLLSPFIAIGFIWYITVTSFKTGYNWNEPEQEHEDLDVHIDMDHEIKIREDVR